jgi:multiple sugar transport system permease protein
MTVLGGRRATTTPDRDPPPVRRKRRTPRRTSGTRPQWGRFAAVLVITVVVLIPIYVTLFQSVRPGTFSSSTSVLTLEHFTNIFTNTDVVTWLGNSLGVTLATVLVSVAVATPAGYVLSRARSRAISAYSLLLFIVQSLPIITAVVPLFVLFAKLGLVDNLIGVAIVYIGSTMSVATWIMAAYFDSIPRALEEAAWIDGCSVFGSFRRIVLPNSLPGILSTAVFAFLLAWNDYLVALVFLKSSNVFTLPVGVQGFFLQNATDWGPVMAASVVMLLPPTIVFVVLNRYFSVGGIGGSLAGR